ncbi:MAG: efflux RND transporter periplasmic adaptor subunit [Eubacteriales bacterium]|nr:efflux RND transporter periplasmic adaptor subunit [Eubacteriales bacterium]
MSKKKMVYPVIGALLILGAGGGYYMRQNPTAGAEESQSVRTEAVQKGSVITGITEDGTVDFGSNTQVFSIAEADSDMSSSDSASAETAGGMGNNAFPDGMGMTMNQSGGSEMQGQSSGSSSGSEVSLEVEKVYVSDGQVVKVGDPILKITDESIANYREKLEAAVSSAELAVRKESINTESKKAEAEYTYNMYLAEGETAEETYKATITSLENAVTDLEEDLEEAKEELADLEEESEAGEDVEDELEEAQLNVETLEANLQVARNDLTTQSIEAKQTYENAMTNYKYADQLYEIDTDGLEDDLNAAKETQSEAEEALNSFNSQIGDGIVYAEYAGSITSVAYTAGDTLTNDSELAAYTDDEQVTMTIAITQDDIANIAVGDSAVITLSPYGEKEFPGEVESIESASSRGGTVVYDVTVRFTGDTSKVYAGMTGEVTIVRKSAENVLNVSNRAVYLNGANSYVKVVKEDGSIQETQVKTGFSNGSRVEITSGLEEGESVVIESQVTE